MNYQLNKSPEARCHNAAMVLMPFRATAMLLFMVSSLVFGANRYWSGTKTWNSTNVNWGTVTGGPYTASTFATGSDAIFQGVAGTVTVGTGPAPNNPNSLTFTVTGYTLNSNTLTLGGASINTNVNTATISSIIAGSAGLTKSGTGTLILLTATNTYSGGTTISAGTVQIGNNATPSTENVAALGTGTVTVNTGGVLYYMPGSTANPYNITNAFTLNGGTIKCGDGVQHLGNGGAAFTIGASGGTITSDWLNKDMYIDGLMSGTAALNLSHGTMAGQAAGICITNSANTYSGTATVTSSGNNQVLYLDNITAMQYATITLASGGAGTPYLQLGPANANLTTIIAGLTSSAGVGIVNTDIAAGTYTLNVNNVADNTFGGVLANNTGILALTKTGAGTLTLTGTNTCTGVTIVTAGTLSIGAGGTAGVISNSSNITDNSTLTFNRSDAYTYTGVISGAGAMIKEGAGTTTLTGNQTHTGLTTVNAGTLRLTGTPTSNARKHVINSGATISIPSRTNMSAYPASTVADLVTINGGTLSTGSSDGNPYGPYRGFTLGASGGTIDIPNTDNTNVVDIQCIITGSGALTKTGIGTLRLTGTNDYTGTTTISAGTLQLGAGTAIPDGATYGNVSLTGTLDLNNQSEGINGLSGAGTVTSSVAGSRTLTVGNNDQTSTFAGTIIAGLGTTALTKAGTGSLTLSNTNTYTGATTVSAGTLLVTGSTAAGAVGVTATLGGTGTVGGAITLNNGSTLAPGTGGTTIGTLTTAGVSFSATSTYSVNLDGNATPNADKINSTSGIVALGAAANTLTVSSIVNSANADAYIIINAASRTGTFSGKAEASTFVVSGRTLRINYAANQVTLTDVTVGLTPAWMQSSLGTINGGAINESALYLATGSSDYLYSRSLTDGSEKWNYPTGHGACGQPTYFYTGAVYKVLASAVDWVIARQDDGASSSQIFAPLNLAGAGTPYVSYNGASFFVPYTGNLTKRSMADPTSGPVTVAVGSISTSADIVEGSDFVYCATTNGYVNRYDAADLTNLTQSTQISTGPSVNLPLVYSMGTLYVTPNNSTVQAFTTSTMGAAKWSMTYSGAATGATNTGPAYIIQSRDTLYTAAGNYVVKVGCVSGSGTQKWVYDAGGAVNSGPICYSATVYFGRNGGSYYAIDDATGLIRANWPYTSASGNATSGPWIDETNTRVIFGTTGGNLDAFALEP